MAGDNAQGLTHSRSNLAAPCDFTPSLEDLTMRKFRLMVMVVASMFVGYVHPTETIAEPFRAWSDASGEYSIVAELISSDDADVTLRTKNGRVVSLPLARLSAADQKFIGDSRVVRKELDPRVAKLLHQLSDPNEQVRLRAVRFLKNFLADYPDEIVPRLGLVAMNKEEKLPIRLNSITVTAKAKTVEGTGWLLLLKDDAANDIGDISEGVDLALDRNRVNDELLTSARNGIDTYKDIDKRNTDIACEAISKFLRIQLRSDGEGPVTPQAAIRAAALAKQVNDIGHEFLKLARAYRYDDEEAFADSHDILLRTYASEGGREVFPFLLGPDLIGGCQVQLDPSWSAPTYRLNVFFNTILLYSEESARDNGQPLKPSEVQLALLKREMPRLIVECEARHRKARMNDGDNDAMVRGEADRVGIAPAMPTREESTEAASDAITPPPTDSGLWDVKQGIAVTAHSPVWTGSDFRNMFGGTTPNSSLDKYEWDKSLFASTKGGTVQFVEWETLRPVTIRRISLARIIHEL